MRHPAHQKRQSLRFPAFAMVLMLVASLVILPAQRALADGQVLELPSAAANPSPPPEAEPAAEPATPPAEVAAATPPPNVGSIDDYMHQDGQPAQSYNQPNYGQPYSSPQPDPRNNPPSMTNTAIMGAIAVGLIALDIYAAHHHRHR